MCSPDGATRASTSSYRLSASPSASNPGPRLALVAGTRTRTGSSSHVTRPPASKIKPT